MKKISLPLLQERIRKRYDKEMIRETGGAPKPASFHRGIYHREMEGYTETTWRDAKGRPHIRRVYTGHYYVPDLSRRRLTMRKFLYVLLAVISAVLFGWGATREIAANTVPLTAFLQVLSVLVYLWLAYLVLFYGLTSGRMTIGDYNTIHKPLVIASLLQTILLWSTAISTLVVSLLSSVQSTGLLGLCCVSELISGFLMMSVFWLEGRLEYHVERNEKADTIEGVEIE